MNGTNGAVRNQGNGAGVPTAAGAGPSPFAPAAARQNAQQEVADSFGLGDLDAEFAQAKAASNDDVPDGKYQVSVESVRLATSQSGNPMLKYVLLVRSGPHEGRRIFKNAVMTPASMPFFKGDLATMGIELSRLSDLPARLNDMLDCGLEVTKRTKNDFANVYFDRRLSIPRPTAFPADSGLPF